MRTPKQVTSWERIPVIFDLDYAEVLTGVPRNSLKYLASKKRFPAFKVGKLWKIRKEDLKCWIDAQLVGVEVHKTASERR